MRGISTLLLSAALVCGVWRASEAAKSKHFETVYSWSEVDFVFPDEETRAAMLADHSFIPGVALPMDFEVDDHTGRIFLSTTKLTGGVPYSLSTVSDLKSAKDQHLLQPYPDHAMHTKGCEGITSVQALNIDECGRLWVVDMGSIYTEGFMEGFSQLCPAKVVVFDLKTNLVVKEFKIPEKFAFPYSYYSTVAVDVVSSDNECQNTFAYIADTGDFHMIVYDMAHDDAWTVEANVMYPDPKFGHFHYQGVHFDGMYGIYGLSLAPKHENGERTLYFNSFASGKDSYVSTSLLKNKTHFAKNPSHDMAYYVYSQFHTFPISRPGGQSSMGPVFNDMMFYGSIQESAVYCWNHKTTYELDNIVQLDRDEEMFDMFGQFTFVTHDGGVPELYVMSNSFEKFMFGVPNLEETHFHIAKASVNKLVEGTICGNLVTA